MNQVEIYQTKDKQTQIEVKFEGETVWLTQYQLAQLFSTDRTSILKHLKNIFKTKELDEHRTCAKFAQVQKEGKKTVTRDILHYNLDAIISVGYRVNSKRGTQFRQWATQRLKDYLVKGYALNQKRLEQLQQVVNIIQQSGNAGELSAAETKGLLEIITNYTQSFILLNRFDSKTLPEVKLNENITYEIQIDEAVSAIEELKKQLLKKKEASVLFGKQKDESFAGILKSIVQTFGGEYLYKSIEEQAAHLLYFVIKNHPFTDGNKRIGAFLFVWFLEKNKHRFKKSGELKINDNALVALALLVAQSNPDDKEIMIKLVMNLIRG
ncbi:MAG TPA: virulence protein RhuM/Fic/DOC family protein [Chitinophagaceae bacterium]|nr:virulence protein RhuM/Fic/DOC family protein [Chitinophagaceae bacterium]